MQVFSACLCLRRLKKMSILAKRRDSVSAIRVEMEDDAQVGDFLAVTKTRLGFEPLDPVCLTRHGDSTPIGYGTSLEELKSAPCLLVDLVNKNVNCRPVLESGNGVSGNQELTHQTGRFKVVCQQRKRVGNSLAAVGTTHDSDVTVHQETEVDLVRRGQPSVVKSSHNLWEKLRLLTANEDLRVAMVIQSALDASADLAASGLRYVVDAASIENLLWANSTAEQLKTFTASVMLNDQAIARALEILKVDQDSMKAAQTFVKNYGMNVYVGRFGIGKCYGRNLPKEARVLDGGHVFPAVPARWGELEYSPLHAVVRQTAVATGNQKLLAVANLVALFTKNSTPRGSLDSAFIMDIVE